VWIFAAGSPCFTNANSSITLLECVNNFLLWSGTSIPNALKAVTATPAAMLGLQGVKGSLEAGADADLVILSDVAHDGSRRLILDEVWKFGSRVHRADKQM
jgi:N-acetylglucosamine-6-phosphate deacetylase